MRKIWSQCSLVAADGNQPQRDNGDEAFSAAEGTPKSETKTAEISDLQYSRTSVASRPQNDIEISHQSGAPDQLLDTCNEAIGIGLIESVTVNRSTAV